MRLIFTLLLHYFLLTNSRGVGVIRDRIPANVTITCDYLYKETADVWLMGEVSETSPFATQLSAVYSYALVSDQLFTHIVAGRMSVHEPAERRAEDGVVMGWRLSSRPFSDFFDLDHYAAYFRKHRMHTISYEQYFECFTAEKRKKQGKQQLYRHRVVELIRTPEFYPYQRKDFHMLLFLTNSTALIAKKFLFPFLPHQQIRILSRYKLTAFFTFWNEVDKLKYVLKAVAPAKAIVNAVDEMQDKIEPNSKKNKKLLFVAVHVRLDDEGFERITSPSSSSLSSFSSSSPELKDSSTSLEMDDMIIKQSLDHIIKSSCLAGKKDLKIYLFTNRLVNQTTAARRFHRLAESLSKSKSKSGHMVFIRKSWFSYLAADNDNAPSPHFPSLPLISNHLQVIEDPFGFTPEQLTYIDMLLGERSGCFLPSFFPSFTSYMVQRHRNLRKMRFESFSEVNQSSYGHSWVYRDWGF